MRRPLDRIYLLSNQPVMRRGGEYHTLMRNFIDFLAELSSRDTKRYRIVAPCQEMSELPEGTVSHIRFPAPIDEVASYEGHSQALRANVRTALGLARRFKKEAASGRRIAVCGPGPNTLMYVLSHLLPVHVPLVFFIRGDTVQTVRHIYAKRRFGWVVPTVFSRFQARIGSLGRQGRATVFAYGEELRKRYAQMGCPAHNISPLIARDFVHTGVRPAPDPSVPLRVLYAGRFSQEKNVMALLTASSRAVSEGTRLQLTLAGRGPLHETMLREHADLFAAGTFRMAGYLAHEQVADAIDTHDLVCLPSFTEGTPRLIVEAFARQAAVLATPVGSVPHMFPDETIFIKGFDASDIHEGLLQACRNRVRLRELGLAGAAKVERYLLDVNADVVDALLRPEEA